MAEAIGTFLLVFCGTGAVIIDEVTGGSVTHVGIACTFGLTVAVVIYAFGPISGANINPAATIALWAARHLPGRLVLPYILAQLLGALTASKLLHLLFPTSVTLGATLPAGSAWQSFGLEIVLAFFLFLVVLLLLQHGIRHQHLIGAAAGSVVLLEAMFAGPICGASMNPARSIGPAVISGDYTSLWVYLIAPFVGAMLAVLLASELQGQSET